MLAQLIFVSIPVNEYAAEINSSLPEMQLKNRDQCINGMMLSHTNFYLQIVEGERDVVNALYNEIVCDRRYADVSIIRYQEVMRSQFTDWYYAVVDTNLDHEFYQYITDLVTIDANFVKDLTSATAMGLLRRAAAIVLYKTMPNRRASDVKEIPTL